MLSAWARGVRKDMCMSQGFSFRIVSIPLVAASLLLLAATAEAQTLQNGAAADQYTEAIPLAGGPRATKDHGDGSLPPRTEAALQQKGADGSATATLAKVTAPRSGSGSGSGADGSDTGTSGMGFALPLLLGASLLAAIALVARRRIGAMSG
jgi:hypothetical protein